MKERARGGVGGSIFIFLYHVVECLFSSSEKERVSNQMETSAFSAAAAGAGAGAGAGAPAFACTTATAGVSFLPQDCILLRTSEFFFVVRGFFAFCRGGG